MFLSSHPKNSWIKLEQLIKADESFRKLENKEKNFVKKLQQKSTILFHITFQLFD